jgi:hypothetical protein
MSTAQAIFAGALVIAASILFANSVHSAQAAIGGPYQLMHHSNTNANAGVFRLDTSSGEVSYCYISGEGNLVCSAGVK